MSLIPRKRTIGTTLTNIGYYALEEINRDREDAGRRGVKLITAPPSPYPAIDWHRNIPQSRPVFAITLERRAGHIPWGPGLFDDFSGGGMADPFLF